MTPELQAAMEAVMESVAWGYGSGIGFVVFALLIGKSKGGE